MSVQQDCYKNVYGISQTKCNCFTDKPGYTDGTISDSGIWLDETEGINLNVLQSIEDCTNGNLWEIAARCRKEAISQYKIDLMSCINSVTRMRRRMYQGTIGDDSKSSKYIPITSNFVAFKLCVANIIGGSFLLKRIALSINQNFPITLYLYNNQSSSPLFFWNLTPNAGESTWFTLAAPVKLPMENRNGRGYLEYYFVYAAQPSLSYKNVLVDCGCGGYHPTYDEYNPQFNTEGDKGKHQWGDWAMCTGVYGSAIADRTSWSKMNETAGIMLDVQFGCRPETTICNGELDYEYDPMAIIQAHTIRYLGAAKTLKAIIDSPNINRYTVAPLDTLMADVANYTKAYQDRIMYLCKEITKPQNINRLSDCLTCEDLFGVSKGQILITGTEDGYDY